MAPGAQQVPSASPVLDLAQLAAEKEGRSPAAQGARRRASALAARAGADSRPPAIPQAHAGAVARHQGQPPCGEGDGRQGRAVVQQRSSRPVATSHSAPAVVRRPRRPAGRPARGPRHRPRAAKVAYRRPRDPTASGRWPAGQQHLRRARRRRSRPLGGLESAPARARSRSSHSAEGAVVAAREDLATVAAEDDDALSRGGVAPDRPAAADRWPRPTPRDAGVSGREARACRRARRPGCATRRSSRPDSACNSRPPLELPQPPRGLRRPLTARSRP